MVTAGAFRRQLLQSSRRTNYLHHRSQRATVDPNFLGVQPTCSLSISSITPFRLPWKHSTTVADASSCRNLTTKNIKESKSESVSRFDELALHPWTLGALQKQGIHELTDIQAKSYNLILNGHSVLARSRTGTGKTLAFLLPSIERILKSEFYRNQTKGIPILVIAPTRELAGQIATEANKILSEHARNHEKRKGEIRAQVVYGGTSKKEDVRKFEEVLPTILVATPGRLIDHLNTTKVNVSRVPANHDPDNHGSKATATKIDRNLLPFSFLFQNGNLQTLVLDETDRLLELGFRKDMQQIFSYLKESTSSSQHPKRQTLLFSATLPTEVKDFVHLAMPATLSNIHDGKIDPAYKNYYVVDCIDGKEQQTRTNHKTGQSYVILPTVKFWTGTLEILLQLMTKASNTSDNTKRRNKMIVFFEMTRLVQLYAKFLSLRLGHTVGVWEIHGKMHQNERSLVARRFRNASHGVLLTSDVSARGVDYPDVSHVIQVGASQDRETYIHRVGRTGRAGKTGEGILILPEFEQGFLKDDLKGLDILLDESLQQQLLSKRKKSTAREIRVTIQNELGMLRHDLSAGTESTGMEESIRLAYQSLVSYYFQTRRRHDGGRQSSEKLIMEFINQLVEDFGLPELPSIEFGRAKNAGIETLSGINIKRSWSDQHWGVNANDRSNGEDFDDLGDWFGSPRSARKDEKK